MSVFRKILSIVLVCSLVVGMMSALPCDVFGAEWDAEDLAAIEHILNFTDNGQTPYTDEEFYGKFDNGTQKWVKKGFLAYDKYEGLQSVRQSAKAGDYSAAKSELLEFYRDLYSGYTPAYTSSTSTQRQKYSAYAVKNNFQLNYWMIPAIWGIPAVGSTNGEISLDITDRMPTILSQSSPQVTVELFGLKKDGTSLEFESINAGKGHPPTVELTVNGVVTKYVATDDATISPMTNYNKNYGKEPTLKAQESTSSIGLARLSDSNTKRSLIKFDFTDASKTAMPSKAVLKLYGKNASGVGSGELLAAEFNNNAWNEEEVTFYQGKSGAAMEHATFSNYGEDTFKFNGGTSPDKDGTNDVFAYRYPEELLRFTWATVLAQLYVNDKNEEYAVTFLDQWVGYLEQRGSMARYDKTLDGHCRDRDVAQIMSVMLSSEHMTPDIWSATMKYYYMEAKAQIESENDTGNWGVYQIYGTAAIATYAPTFDIYDDIINVLADWSAAKIDEAFYSDGSAREIEWSYAFTSTFNQLLEAEELLGRGTVKATIFPYGLKEKCKNILKYFASFLMPGGGSPQVGDGTGYNDNIYKGSTRNQKYNDLFGASYWNWLGSEGALGTKPDWTTARFSGTSDKDDFKTGVYTSRNSWNDNALYLYTDVDGNMSPGHGHQDDNQVIIKAYGQYLLVDNSFSSYASSRVPLDNTKYHNTVTIDDATQSMQQTAYEKNYSGKLQKEKRFETNNQYDNFTLMTPQNADFYGLHTRNTLFIRSGYWIVNDYLQPSDKNAEHKLDQNWHMLPAANPTVDFRGTGRSNFSGTANIQIAQADMKDTAASVLNGYFGGGAGKMYDSNYLNYEKTVKGNAAFNTVIYPERPGEKADVSAREYPLKDVTDKGAAAMNISISSNYGTYIDADYYLVNDASQQKERAFGTYSTDGRSAYINRDINKNVSEIILQDGTHITDTLTGKTIFKSNTPVEEIGIERTADKVKISSSKKLSLENMTFYAAGINSIKSVEVNGEEVSYNTSGRYIYFGDSPIETDGDYSGNEQAAQIGNGQVMLADFSDKTTCVLWGKGANQTKVPGDNTPEKGAYIAGDGYELDYTTDTGNMYMSKNSSVFHNLNFADSTYLRFKFKLSVDKSQSWNAGLDKVNNYFTIVLSTGENTGIYSEYKKNECLTYEIDMSKQPLNEDTELLIPLSSFVTQFDGMRNGVQGTKDGKTPLIDIKSISILGASMAKSEVGGTGSPCSSWAFSNAKWAGATDGGDKSCGIRVKKIELLTDAAIARESLDENMAKFSDKIAEDMPLPKKLGNASVKWESDKPGIIANDGSVARGESDEWVTLTARLYGNDKSVSVVKYYVCVCGEEKKPDLVIADFSDRTVAQSWLDSSSDTKNVGFVADGCFYYSWAAYASGGGYLANNADKFGGLNFADYKALKLKLKILSENIINNYFTVVLSTSENPGKVYKTDECLAIEVDISKLPRNDDTVLYIPFEDFVTEFDGMKNGVQGAKDGITDLSDIKSISIYPGAAKVESEERPWNGIGATSDVFHNYTDWAFKTASGADNKNSCTMRLNMIELMREKPTACGIYKTNNKIADDLAGEQTLKGRAVISGVGAGEQIYSIIASYCGGKLAEYKMTRGVSCEGYIETPEMVLDADKCDKISVFMWDKNLRPLIEKSCELKK